MSHAFVKYGDEMWLRDIPPTMDALLFYLTRENGGLPVTERGSYFHDELQVQVFKMSDGFEYIVKNNKWEELP